MGAVARAGLQQGSLLEMPLVRKTRAGVMGLSLFPEALCDPRGGVSVLPWSTRAGVVHDRPRGSGGREFWGSGRMGARHGSPKAW